MVHLGVNFLARGRKRIRDVGYNNIGVNTMIKTTATKNVKPDSQACRLFISKDGSYIVLSYDEPKGETFTGTVIHVEERANWKLGCNKADWLLSSHKPYYGKITISIPML